jgi:Kef-type K+ transport system membrane component KefB
MKTAMKQAIVPPLGGGELEVFLLQIGVLLILALVLGQLAVRFRMPAIVGELAAGVLLGPTVFGHLAPAASNWLLPPSTEQFHVLDGAGQLGAVLLVGMTGVLLDLKLVRRRAGTVAAVSLPGLILPLGLGIAAGYLIPSAFLATGQGRGVFAFFIGVAMSVSAIPVIAKTLSDMGLLHRNIGQLTLAAGSVDDACGWLLLSIVTVVATTGAHAGDFALAVGRVAGFGAVAFLIGRPAVRLFLRALDRTGSDGAVMAGAVVTIVLGAGGAAALGLEPVFGAFVAGIVIGLSGVLGPKRLAPMRGFINYVLAPVFFATAGLRINLWSLGTPAAVATVLLLLAVAVVSKFGGAYAGGKAAGLTRWEALALGAGMNSRGVVQLVMATVGLRLGILTTTTYTFVVLIAISTSLMAVPVLRLAMAHVEYTADEKLRESVMSEAPPAVGRETAPAPSP